MRRASRPLLGNDEGRIAEFVARLGQMTWPTNAGRPVAQARPQEPDVLGIGHNIQRYQWHLSMPQTRKGLPQMPLAASQQRLSRRDNPDFPSRIPDRDDTAIIEVRRHPPDTSASSVLTAAVQVRRSSKARMNAESRPIGNAMPRCLDR